MSNLLSLTWRFLLAAALVFNPVLGAASMLASGPAQGAGANLASASTQTLPCHAMAQHAMPKCHDCATPGKGRGCGIAACQYGACCTVGALDLPATLYAPALHMVAQPQASRDFQQAAAPPPARIIRPPIA